MKRSVVVMSVAVWLIAMTALPTKAQGASWQPPYYVNTNGWLPTFPTNMTVQEYRHVRVYSTVGLVDQLTMQKFSKAWEVLNRIALGRYFDQYFAAIPTPADIFFLQNSEIAAIPPPYTSPTGEYAGFYERNYDGVVILGDLVSTFGWHREVDGVIHELEHRLFRWLERWDAVTYPNSGGYHPMIAMPIIQATSALIAEKASASPEAGILTETRANRLWDLAKGPFVEVGWPVELVPVPVSWSESWAWHYETMYLKYSRLGVPWVAEQLVAAEMARAIPNFFNTHMGPAAPPFFAVRRLASAIVERECAAGCP